MWQEQGQAAGVSERGKDYNQGQGSKVRAIIRATVRVKNKVFNGPHLTNLNRNVTLTSTLLLILSQTITLVWP